MAYYCATTFSIVTLSIMTLSTIGLIVTESLCNTQHKVTDHKQFPAPNVIMLSATSFILMLR
jgi:hypothetical protein